MPPRRRTADRIRTKVCNVLSDSRSCFRKLVVAVLLGAVVGWLAGDRLQRAVAADPEAPTPGKALQLHPFPEPFVPARPPTAAERRRVEALALFATARAAQQQEQYEPALRLYQRALRCDPHAAPIARAIVPLAIQLNRPAVAVRYAMRAVELEEADPVLLRRLAEYMTEQGDWEQAVRLYERALAAREGRRETATDIHVRKDVGRLCYVLERHEEAAEHFARVLHALENPEDFALDEETVQALLDNPAPTYTLFADVFLAAGRLEEAKAAYRKADEAAPNPGRLEVNRARVFLESGRPEETLETLEAAFEHKLDPDRTTPYRVLLDALGRLDRTGEALPRLEALREQQGDAPAVRHVLAEQYVQGGKLDEAAELFEQLIEEAPTMAAFRGLVEAYRRAGRVEPLLRVAGALAEKAGALDGLESEQEEIAQDHELLGKLIEAAQQQDQEAENGLDHGRALATALLALEGGRFDAAGEFFDVALAARPQRDAELLVTWGMGLLLSDEPGKAAEVFRRAIDQAVQPASNPLFYFYLAGALELDGRTDGALEAARKAAELDPDSPRIQGRVGWVYYHAGRYDEAIDAYRRLIERFDDDHSSPETRDVMRQAKLVLSHLHVLQDNYAGAEGRLEEVLDEFPDDPGALNDLGYLWADQNKNLHRALEMIERAVATEPDNAAFRDSLGWVYYRLGRYEEAVVELEKAAGLEDEPDPIILDHLGDAYAAAGRTEKARKAWRRAAEAFHKADKPEEAAKVEEKISVPEIGPNTRGTPAEEPHRPNSAAANMGPSLFHT